MLFLPHPYSKQNYVMNFILAHSPSIFPSYNMKQSSRVNKKKKKKNKTKSVMIRFAKLPASKIIRGSK